LGRRRPTRTGSVIGALMERRLDAGHRGTDMSAKGFSGSPSASAAAPSADLVARAQRGEESAFAALFAAYNRRIYSVCLRITGSQAEAEDLTQEVFLKLFRKIATFRGESRFSTWLHRLAVNEVLMYLRRKRLDTVSLDGVDASRGDPLKPEYRREYGNDDLRLTATLDRISLNRAVAALPPGYRAAFLLHDVEGYEHSEIARMRNWSVGNSKSQLHKARRRLRDWLASKTEKQFAQRVPRRA
jgi:RNA polymerase sigma-70 factor, ECF subfamily